MESKLIDVVNMEMGSLLQFYGCDALCDEVFSNGLIFRKLEKLLSYSDLKICRLVCRRFNWTIVKETDFSVRTIFELKEKTLRDKVLENIGFTLKELRIHPFHADPADSLSWEAATAEKSPLTEEDVEHAYEKCKEIECLALVDDCISIGAKMMFYPSVKRIIEGAANLKKLELSTFDMDNVVRDRGGLEIYWQSLMDVHIVSVENCLEMGVTNSIGNLGNLKRIKISDGGVIEGLVNERSRLHQPSNVPIPTLIKQNQATLEYLHMYKSNLWKILLLPGLPDVSKTHFPKLHEVHIRTRDNDVEDVATFLTIHLKQLDALTIRILGEFPVSVLGLIKENAAKFKTLNIETKQFDKSSPMELAFIADCSNLHDFGLQFIHSNNHAANGDSLVTIFSYIPTSVRNLRLMRLPNSGADSLSLSKIQMLSKLNSLTLVGCFDAVTNDSLQAIFKYMISLRKLNVAEARKCTDEGFTGMSFDRTVKGNGFSVSNLKLLSSLTLRDCGITDRTVQEGIRFIDLTVLDITENGGITSASCNVALGNNPSLEILRTDYFDDFGSPDDIKSLKENHPRFRQFLNPVYGEMEDVDASEDEGGDGDSDFSGGAMEHAYHDEFDDYEGVDDDYDDEDDDEY